MEIKLSNGAQLNALGVHGRKVNYQGVQRDCLIILIDPQTVTVEQVCAAFTEENCRSIEIADSDGTYIHEHYTIRVEVGQGYKDMALTGGVSGNDMTQVVYVRMAQSTLAEREIQQQREVIDQLIVSALEEG